MNELGADLLAGYTQHQTRYCLVIDISSLQKTRRKWLHLIFSTYSNSYLLGSHNNVHLTQFSTYNADLFG